MKTEFQITKSQERTPLNKEEEITLIASFDRKLEEALLTACYGGHSPKPMGVLNGPLLEIKCKDYLKRMLPDTQHSACR